MVSGVVFFQYCWNIIKHDVVDAVNDFLSGGYLNHFFKSSIITLIPKVSTPANFSIFRPISLSNFTLKFFSKVLASRMKLILPAVISLEQGAFVKNRNISDNIQIVQELAYDLNKKSRGGNMIIKLDMEKAFDRLDWSFLFHVLVQFGFSSQLVKLVKMLVCHGRHSVMVNGKISGFFWIITWS